MGLLGAKSIVNKLHQLQWGIIDWPPRLPAWHSGPAPPGPRGSTPDRPCPPPPGAGGVSRGPREGPGQTRTSRLLSGLARPSLGAGTVARAQDTSKNEAPMLGPQQIHRQNRLCECVCSWWGQACMCACVCLRWDWGKSEHLTQGLTLGHVLGRAGTRWVSGLAGSSQVWLLSPHLVGPGRIPRRGGDLALNACI